MDCLSWETIGRVFIGFMVILSSSYSYAYTDPRDVFAVNSLYASLGYPSLPGWVPNGGDPCSESWQGIECVNANITGLILNGANLGGVLGDNLGFFSSIMIINLSNNRIGGSIPSSLPLTTRNLFLSANQFVGSIPSSLSTLGQLTDVSLNNNLLTGEIPDAFQTLPSLINMDLSDNNLSGQLPPSMGSLTAMASLHMQNNQLTGVLNVLQDLPALKDLNIENNLFSGPIPERLLTIPNFKKDGNPFNTTVMDLPPPPAASASDLPPPPAPSGAPASRKAPPAPIVSAKGPSSPARSGSQEDKGFWTTKKVVLVGVAVLFVTIALGLVVFMLCCNKKRHKSDGISKMPGGYYKGIKEKPVIRENLVEQKNVTDTVNKEAAEHSKNEHRINIRTVGMSKQKDDVETDSERMGVISMNKEEHEMDILGMEKVIVKPNVLTEATRVSPVAKALNLPPSVRSFTIASLQQYTNSFSQENFIGQGMLGSVYKAELPDGKVLAVKKFNSQALIHYKDDQFFQLVSSVNKLRHANVVELVGYCAEHGQRLLISDYCSNGTLYDALHSDNENNKRLSWNARVRISLGAARALEYLHEVCQPPVVHRNFKSANILLDDEISVHVADCGLASLLSSDSASQLPEQLSAKGYNAPEFEWGTYTYQSDVFSFGVVMLELLTGRKAYDRLQPRGEQFLVRWAIPQLHDFDALSKMVDPSLTGAYPAKSLSRYADIISLCVQAEPEFRPPMSEIVQNFVHLIQRETLNKKSYED
ncbi:protein STRUBBELIG-RECEPTOR FAMILY 3-like [Papaver somniferum]|uniref:protein STRUBBELIG-RECEPTOR FAMILY 3-like n=1 Tax=Papaver somniferum TaxID=3469 RepID=UPI000E705882|nr:protein STRUBBELIG-RECEPTOR FAMILY 3-like [Papaver somniferum]